MKILLKNKKAFFDYEILHKYEAGIQLLGWEVRSLKDGNAHITGAFIRNRGNEFFLFESRIGILKSAFEKDLKQEHRERKLLLHKNEVRKILAAIKEKGTTIVPLEVYVNDRGFIKISMGIGKGKKKYDKREKIKSRDLQRSLDLDRKVYKF
jgi:SsrA-binding protein